MNDFLRTKRLVSASAVFSTAERCGQSFARAWREHPMRRRLRLTWDPLESWQRLRVIGWILIVAMVTSAVAQLLLSPRGVVGLPAQVILFGIGVALFVGSRAWVHAWNERRERRAADSRR